MAKREVKRSFTFEQQRQEINLIADDAGDKSQLDPTNLSPTGQSNLVDAINEVIEAPSDDIFIDEINNAQPQYSEDQRLIFADSASFVDAGSYSLNPPNPENLDYSRVKYDFGSTGGSSQRLSYNPNKKELRAQNIKGDLRNRNADPNGAGQYVVNVNSNVDAHSPSETARFTGRLRTTQTNAPIEIQKNLIKLEEAARMSLANSSAIDLFTGVDVGAYINVTNNKKILYVSADDENASDLPTNDGSNINRPFKSIERALIEASKRSYVGPGQGNELGEPGTDLFENFTILLFPGEYIIDNSPGVDINGNPYTVDDIAEEVKYQPGEVYANTASFANELPKFNPPEGGLIVPRGTSIVGLDLRKTLIRPKYVPDPADETVASSAMFRLTGACYIWQFTIKDTPNAFGSHHKLTAFEYASYIQLEDYYRKIDKYSRKDESTTPPSGRFKDAETLLLKNKKFIAQLAVAYVERNNAQLAANVDNLTGAGDTVGQACVDDTMLLIERIAYNLAYGGNNRIVEAAQYYIDNPAILAGELPESKAVFEAASEICQYVINNYNVIEDKNNVITRNFSNVFATTNLNLDNSFITQIYDFSLAPDTSIVTSGYDIDDNTDPANCANVRSGVATSWSIIINTIQSIINGSPSVVPSISPSGEEDYNQRIEENRIVGFVQNKYLSDTVASASPYVFNISLRSVWGLCGLLSDGAQSTGLRSMVLAQYTGISLQRDDRAFILNGTTTNQVEDPDQRHSSSIAEYRDDWRHFHIKSTNNSFLQIVSVFAVGQADHFTVETGGDHSITNSNSNFGNQSLIAVSHRTEVFKQDDGAYIVGLVPPRGLDPTKESKVNVYNIDYGTTLAKFNAADQATASDGFRKIYLKIDGQSLIKEGDIPEYYSIDPVNTREKAELLLDDVNYLLGKRTYSDGFPEAVYARLPKNFEDSTLRTFGARLREASYYSSDPQDYDPRPTYSEGKIINEQSSLIGVASGPAAIRTSLKNFYVLDPTSNLEISDPNFGNTNIFGGSTLTTSSVHFGAPSTGLPEIRSSVRMKMITGTGGNYLVAVAESEIKTIAPEGNSVQLPSGQEFRSYTAISGTPQSGQVSYTYQPVSYGNPFDGNDPSIGAGQAARFEVIRTSSTNRYVVKILTRGVEYNVGDSFFINGASLGGASSTDPVGHIVTANVNAPGTGYSIGAATAQTGTATFNITSVGTNGSITGIEVINGGSGYTSGSTVVVVQGGNVTGSVTTDYVYDGTNDNDLTIHVVAVANSGSGVGRLIGDFEVTFTDSDPAALGATENVRIYCTDATLPSQVIYETNDLEDFDSINDVDYTIPSGGFDAEYSFSLIQTSGSNAWQNLGSVENDGSFSPIPSTTFIKTRIKGGSGFSASPGFNLIKFPGSLLSGSDGINDFTVSVTAVGGATINTLNYNNDTLGYLGNPSVKRKYYGWEFARTIDGEYYGRLILLVDDERKNGQVDIFGIPGEFDYTNTGALFNGYQSSTTVQATATTIPGLQFDRTITSITNNLDGTFTIGISNPSETPEHPFYKGDSITLDNVNNSNGQTLDGSYKVFERGNGLLNVIISVPNSTNLPTTGWIVGGIIYKISEAITIPVQATIGNISANQGEVVEIYPNDWVIGAPSQDYSSGWTSSGSSLSYDDVFLLDTGSGTSFLPASTLSFKILVDTPSKLISFLAQNFSSASIKEEGYLSGSALGIDYTPYDENLSLEENTFTYNSANATDNTSLSLFRRITQRVDINASGALEKQSDTFEFNNNIITAVYVKRLQDSRAANGNSELLWRMICKLPKDGYNNIKLRAPEAKFIIHLKDPGMVFGDQTLDYPFVYDYQKTGLIRSVEIGSLAAGSGSAVRTVTSAEYKKTKRRGGNDEYVNYNLIDTTNSIGGTNLIPSGTATFNVNYTTGTVTVNNPGYGYNTGDKLTLSDGSVVYIISAVSTYPSSFYVQKVEPIVEYEYNVRDGYYLLTMLDGNIYQEYNAADNSVSNNSKTIVYGKQRLIGLEDLPVIGGDGINNEINHLKQDGSDLIEKNRLFIQEEAAGYLVAESQPGRQFAGFVNPDANRCKRDIGYLINAIVRDLRLGGNNNVINTAQYYFSVGTQEFIEEDLPQTRETFEYAKNLAIAATRNWEFYAQASSATSSTYTFAAGGLDGVVEGMAVYEATGINTLPTNQTQYNAAEATLSNGVGGLGIPLGYVGNINRSTNTITIYNSQDRDTRVAVNTASNAERVIKFVLLTGMGPDWNSATAYTISPIIDNTIIEDYDYSDGKCGNVTSAVNVLYNIFDDILQASPAVVTSGVLEASFEAPTGSIVLSDTLRIFGAQNAAFNGDLVEVTNVATGAGSGGSDVITYELDVTFQQTLTDNILYYKSTIEFTEPTKTAYDTENVNLEGLGYLQNINYLYPELDLDNPKWNPLPSVTQYRKEVGNTIIRGNNLATDGYDRISQYSVTAESTKGVLNSILTGGAGASGYNNRTFAEIDLEQEFDLSSYGVTSVTNAVMQAPYGFNNSKNEYGVPKSPVLEFDVNNVPQFTDRCIIFNKAVPISFYRPSIIRASSHTWEYVGFGPGNYSTGLPQFQDITLTQQELVNSQTTERGGGFVASSGTNSVGDFYIGNQVIDAKGNQSNTLNFPRVKTSAENRLIDYTNLDSLAANSSTASFNPSSFSAVLTNDLQAIQEAQRNSFKASNIESSILTAGTIKINNKISIANNVFEDESNFPVARQDTYGFTKRSPINWFNTDPATTEYQALADSFISPVDLSDWANVNSLIPSIPVSWDVVYKTNTFNEVSNVGDVNINNTLTKSVNFNVTGIDPIDERWYDAVTDTLSIPLGTPIDNINNTTLATYDGRAGQIYVTFPNSVKASAIIPTNIWKPVENTWTGVSQVDGSPTTYIQGDRFVISYYIASGQIIYSVSTLDA